MENFRLEHDLLGQKEVPAERICFRQKVCLIQGICIDNCDKIPLTVNWDLRVCLPLCPQMG